MDTFEINRAPMERKNHDGGSTDISGPEFAAAVSRMVEETKRFAGEVKSEVAGQNARITELEQAWSDRRQNAGKSNGGSLSDLVKTVSDAPQFKMLKDRNSPRVVIPVKASDLLLDRKAIVNDDTLFQPATRKPGIITPALKRSWLRERMVTLMTTASSIEYVVETAFNNNAAVVYSDGARENVMKPQSTLEFELADAKVPTVAHWLKASKQVLSDSSGLQAFLGGRLLYGLEVKLEAQLLAGDGTGGAMTGLIAGNNTPFDPAFIAEHETLIDFIRGAMTQLETSEMMADVIILNPIDWARIEQAKDEEGRYIVGKPAGGTQRSLWNVPVYTTTGMPQGEFVVAALADSAALWIREDATLDIGYDGNDFTKNMLTMLAELRAVMTVFRPQGVIYGQFPAISGT